MKNGRLRTLQWLAPLAFLTATSAQADTIFGVYAGGQYWDTQTSGAFGTERQQRAFSFEDDQQSSYYIAVEHPIPLVPNVKVRVNDIQALGSVTLEQNYSFNGQTYPAGTTVTGMADLSHTDFTLYYEFFDNDLISFDLGATAKRFDGALAFRQGASNNEASGDTWVPTLYSQVRVGIPATDLTLYALANAVSIDDSSIRDIEAGIEYRLIENLAVDLNLQLGYRDMQIELDDVDGLYSDISFKGPYLGLEIHF